MQEVKQKILSVCPNQRDRYELSLPHVIGPYEVYFHDYNANSFEQILSRGVAASFEKQCPHVIINELIELCEKNNITGIYSSDDYPGSIYASIVAYHKKFKSPLPAVILGCQHKYYSRLTQTKIVPDFTPEFFLIDPHTFTQNNFSRNFPLFIKPVKSYFSFLAQKVTDFNQIHELVITKKMPELFLNQFNWFLQSFGFEPNSHGFIAEQILKGYQVTVEGFVFEGLCQVIGVTDSVMYPGTISFSRFEYPSRLPETVQKKMAHVATTLMNGINFNNGFFNIEMMYNPETDSIYIIEVNPRMSAQFADLYEKVDGFNSFTTALDIAVGKQPEPLKHRGQFTIAASCVMRIFENKRVLKIPSQEQIAKVKERFPESRVFICVEEGMMLSDRLQDGNSFLYGLIHLGARDRQELLEKYEYAKKLLPFIFASV